MRSLSSDGDPDHEAKDRNKLKIICTIAIDVLQIVKDVAEAVPVAGNPLKATCGVIIDVLELIMVGSYANQIPCLTSIRKWILFMTDGGSSCRLSRMQAIWLEEY